MTNFNLIFNRYNVIQNVPAEMVNLQNLVELELEGNPLPSRVAKMAKFSENFVNYLKSPKCTWFIFYFKFIIVLFSIITLK